MNQSIFKNMSLNNNNKNHDHNFFISKDVLDFRLDIFKNLSTYENEIEHNLNDFQLDCINKFSRDKPFKIIECDKNIGSALISNELYDILVYENLSNNTVYTELFENPLKEFFLNIKNNLNTLYNEKHINKSLYDKLFSLNNQKLCSFRLLHKYIKISSVVDQ